MKRRLNDKETRQKRERVNLLTCRRRLRSSQTQTIAPTFKVKVHTGFECQGDKREREWVRCVEVTREKENGFDDCESERCMQTKVFCRAEGLPCEGVSKSRANGNWGLIKMNC